MSTAALAELLPDENYRHTLKLQVGDPVDFFQPSREAAARRSERRVTLSDDPSKSSALLPEGEALLAETLELARNWGSLPVDAEQCLSTARIPWQQLMALGGAWEQDFLLLQLNSGASPRLVGGVVCFPSSWALEEKVGHDVGWIHEAVPGLNSALRGPIDSFLNRLRPGAAYRRHNWGLSRWPHLNQHPALNLPKLRPPLDVKDLWLRMEHQALVALPRSGGVLFGIDVRVFPFSEVIGNSETARRMRRAIQTMPESMARYKNILAVRDELLRLLAD